MKENLDILCFSFFSSLAVPTKDECWKRKSRGRNVQERGTLKNSFTRAANELQSGTNCFLS